MISGKIRCLTLFCLVLVWDLGAVLWQEAPPSPTDTSISRCDVLPVAIRYRQEIQAQIDLAQLPVGVLPGAGWAVEVGLPEILPLISHAHWGGIDLLYRLKSLQR
jgi:hypothetical protein